MSSSSSRATSEEPERPNPGLVAARPVAPRLHLAVPFCIGSVAFYSPAAGDRATHDWTCYLRTRSEHDVCLSAAVACVVFELHRSFGADAKTVLRRPPYAVTRRGWGETSATVTVHWADPLQPPVVLAHYVRLHVPEVPAAAAATAGRVGQPKQQSKPLMARPDAPGDVIVSEKSDVFLFAAPTVPMADTLSAMAHAAAHRTGRCATWPPLPPAVWRAVQSAVPACSAVSAGPPVLLGAAGEEAVCTWLDAIAATLAAENVTLRDEGGALADTACSTVAALDGALNAAAAAIEVSHPRRKRQRSP